MWKNRDDYSVQDEKGRWINTEFPPDSFNQYPHNAGYKNANAEMLYYQFAVMYYDLRIEYQGEDYLAIVDDAGAYIADVEYNPISETYPTANDLIKNFTFPDGKCFPDIVKDAKQIYIDIL